MPVPLVVAAPAAAAAMAYLNARSSLSYDLHLIRTGITSTYRQISRTRKNELSLFYELERRAQHPSSANHPFIIFEGASHTYSQMYDRVLRMGAWLRIEMEVKPNDVVAMDFQNSDTFVAIWFALWAIGARPAFINYNLTGKSLAHCIQAATTKLCLIDPDVASCFDDPTVRSEVGDDVRFVVWSPDVVARAMASPPTRFPDSDRVAPDPATMALLIYTSGTTGLPKPAYVSWGKVLNAATVGSTLLRRTSDDVMYTSMPLYHSAASLLSLGATVICGGTQALGRKFSTKTFWSDVRESKATMIQYVGETLRYLLTAPPQIDPVTGENLDKHHNVHTAFGNGLRPDIWNKFRDRFGIKTIAEFYAATEGPFGTFNLSNNDHSAGAIGRGGWINTTLLGLSVAVVDVDLETDLPLRDPVTGFCRRTPTGEPGEMICKLPPGDVRSRFQGYYNNPKATASKIMRDVFAPGDVYFRTGDMIRWEKNGAFYFSDRIGDTFRWKSENVSTAEVSHTVGLHPSVHEANVYGVELPHHDGRAGCVAITFDSPVPDPDTLRSLAAHVRSTLPRYAQPLFLRLVGEVGKAQTTGTNKQQKHTLRKLGVKPTSDAQIFWLKDDVYVPFEDKDWQRLETGHVKL